MYVGVHRCIFSSDSLQGIINYFQNLNLRKFVVSNKGNCCFVGRVNLVADSLAITLQMIITEFC